MSMNKDDISNFLKNIYSNKSIYLLNYPQEKEVVVSYGQTPKIINEGIKHKCQTQEGSSGSPILLANNQKVIGIHCGAHKNENYNLGFLIIYSIIEFNQKEIIQKKIEIKEENKIIQMKGEKLKLSCLFGKSFLENNFINCEKSSEDVTYLNNEIKYEKIKEICCELLDLCQKIYEFNDKETAIYLIQNFLTKHSLTENININTILNNIVKFTDKSEIGFICKINSPFELCLSRSYLLVTKSQFIDKDDLDDMGYIKMNKLNKVEFLYNKKNIIYLYDLKDRKLLIRDNKIAIFANFDRYYVDKKNILYLDYFFKNNKEKNNSLIKYDNLYQTSIEIIMLVKSSVEENILENEIQNIYHLKMNYYSKLKYYLKIKL